MTKLMKFPCAFAVAALLVSGAIPASADSFSIFGGGHRDRGERVQQSVVATGAPIVFERVVSERIVAEPSWARPWQRSFLPGRSRTPRIRVTILIYEQNYQYDDRDGCRYLHKHDGHWRELRQRERPRGREASSRPALNRV